jgi:hypothetical protein
VDSRTSRHDGEGHGLPGEERLLASFVFAVVCVLLLATLPVGMERER